MDFNLLFAHFSSLSVLVPLSISFMQWRRLSFQLKIITWVLIFSLLIDGISFIFIHYSITTFLLFNILCFIQLSLFLYAFSLLYNKKWFFKLVYSLFVIFYFINFCWIDGPFVFNSNNVASSLILIILSIRYLYTLLSELRELHIYRLPMLWIAYGILAYCSGTLFLLLATNYLLTSLKESYGTLWILNNMLNITQNMLFAIGLWQNYRTVKS